MSLGVGVKERAVGNTRTLPTLSPFGAVASYYIDAPSCEREVCSVVGRARRSGSSGGRLFACTGKSEGSCEFDSGGIVRRSSGEDAEHARVGDR